MSSCVSSGRTPPQGYQTPIDDGDEDEHVPLTPRASSLLQAPSPNSAVMTGCLEGYLDPARISFGSPPSSELNPRGPSPDESFPVFSPPPYEHSLPTFDRRRSSVIGGPTSWTSSLPTRRQSIISSASRSHHTCNCNLILTEQTDVFFFDFSFFCKIYLIFEIVWLVIVIKVCLDLD